jgi:hypothetical protein
MGGVRVELSGSVRLAYMRPWVQSPVPPKKKKKKTQKTEKQELSKMPFESCVDNGMMEYFNP